MADVNLSKAVRSNLLSLQSTAASMAKTQNRLATGLKVNSALDNPSNFFTASALNSRAGDMANLLDSMSSGIKTIEAADNGLKSITKTVESMQSTLRQARQDKTFKTASFEMGTVDTSAVQKLTLSGGAITGADIEIDLNTLAAAATPASLTGSVTRADLAARDAAIAALGDSDSLTLTGADGSETTIDMTGVTDTATLAAKLNNTNADFTASFNGSQQLVITNSKGENFSASGEVAAAFGIEAQSTNGEPATQDAVLSVDQLVTAINTQADGIVRASNDGGKLRIENLSTTALTVTGLTDGKISGDIGFSDIGGNDVRKNLVKQFNDLRDQLDKFADDASFNGINLLRGDKLKLTFNETGTSTIEIQAKDEGGVPTSINNAALGIDEVILGDFDSDTTLDTKLDALATAMSRLRSQASSFGSNLSIVENRTDFTKNMINTLETGAANLTLADTNEEAANLLALQTRQQLSSSALSMASQADQAVLRLF